MTFETLMVAIFISVMRKESLGVCACQLQETRLTILILTLVVNWVGDGSFSNFK